MQGYLSAWPGKTGWRGGGYRVIGGFPPAATAVSAVNKTGQQCPAQNLQSGKWL